MPKNGKMSEAEFAKTAILKLRNGTYKGIHVRYSGFNEAWRKYFNTDPKEGVEKLVKAGKLAFRFCKGGAMIYLPEDAPVQQDTGAEALAKMGVKV